MKIGIFLDHLRVASDQTGKSLEETALEAAGLGIECVHVNGEFWMANEQRVDDLLQKAGLYVEAADGFFSLTQGKDIEKAEEMIRFLSAKNVRHLLMIPGFMHEAQSRASAMDESVRWLKGLCYLARGLHVQCSMEDFDHASAPYGTWQDLKWYTEQLSDMKVCFDTGNFIYFDQNVQEAYEQLASKICMVHLKDRALVGREGERPVCTPNGKKLYPCAVGSGVIPITDVLCRLKKDDFRGCVMIEHFDSADMMADIRASAQWLHEQLN